MTRTQAVNLPPWKLLVWFSKIDDHLQKVIENLKSLASEDEQTDPFLLSRLAENWENLTEENVSFRGVDLLPGWLEQILNNNKKTANHQGRKRARNTHGLPGFLLYNTESYLGSPQDLRWSFL